MTKESTITKIDHELPRTPELDIWRCISSYHEHSNARKSLLHRYFFYRCGSVAVAHWLLLITPYAQGAAPPSPRAVWLMGAIGANDANE